MAKEDEFVLERCFKSATREYVFILRPKKYLTFFQELSTMDVFDLFRNGMIEYEEDFLCGKENWLVTSKGKLYIKDCGEYIV
jgi:hypothetical protein